MLFYTPLEAALGPEELESLLTIIMDDALVGEGLILSYSDLDVQGNEDGSVFVGTFLASSEDHPEGEGIIVVWQIDQTLYFMTLLTPDFAEVEEVWDRAVDSLVANPVAPPAPADTPVPPTEAPPPTTPPKPQPTATTAAPSLPTDKGCYLFENFIDAQANVEITAKDWQWSEVLIVPANGTKVTCLDPGRYAVVVDLPPPWHGYTQDVEIVAGQHFTWPIYGE
jgi:hypothetical protein